MMEQRTGSCNCGAVRFVTSGALRGIVYCHCSQCRRQSGHHFAATRVESDRLAVTGQEEITWFATSPDARRGFCRKCGSNLFWKRVEGTHVSILAGAFDNPTGLLGLCHIFVADKGDYYEITDDLPQFEEDQIPG